MNTPPTPKRFDLDAWKDAFRREAGKRDGHYSLALADPEACIEFALLVTEFTHLEQNMERLAGQILGTDHDTAAHVMRAIVSARARIDLLRAALQLARHNTAKPRDFDEIIDEFHALNGLRNGYVHACYQTSAETGEVFWLRSKKDDPLLLDHLAYEPFDLAAMKAVRKRITELSVRIYRAVGEDLHRTLSRESNEPPRDN